MGVFAQARLRKAVKDELTTEFGGRVWTWCECRIYEEPPRYREPGLGSILVDLPDKSPVATWLWARPNVARQHSVSSTHSHYAHTKNQKHAKLAVVAWVYGSMLQKTWTLKMV